MGRIDLDGFGSNPPDQQNPLDPRFPPFLMPTSGPLSGRFEIPQLAALARNDNRQQITALSNPTDMAVHGKIGFRVRTDIPRPPAELVEKFRDQATSNVADAMNRFHFMDPGIQSRSGLTMCGVATTVDARPGDNLMIHKALEVAEPGDIVVVNTNGNSTSAVFGELMCRTAVGANLGGIVVDGAIRDVDAITALGFPAFSRVVCAGGSDKDGPGEVNTPISCGNTVVMPGDIIIGDADGVVVVPREEAETVLELVIALAHREERRISEINSGELFKAEINDTLKKKGVLPQ